VDTGPVFEKRLAQQSGLGWIGKHNLLINKKGGSWFFIGEIITTLELEYDTPERDHCGSCRHCLNACPTGALGEGHSLDAEKCISYLTIKHKGPFLEGMPTDLKGYIYGCDICQDACTWNKNATTSILPEMSGCGYIPVSITATPIPLPVILLFHTAGALTAGEAISKKALIVPSNQTLLIVFS